MLCRSPRRKKKSFSPPCRSPSRSLDCRNSLATALRPLSWTQTIIGKVVYCHESNFAEHVDVATGSSPHFVVAKARTLPWPSLAALYWERSSGLHYRPHCCLVCSYGPLAFLTPFVFLLLHRFVICCRFSVKLSPWNRLPSPVISSTSLSSFRSAVRCYFVSDMFSCGLSWFFSLILFVGFPFFICIFVFCCNNFFCSLFSSSSISFFVCVVVPFSQRKGPD